MAAKKCKAQNKGGEDKISDYRLGHQMHKLILRQLSGVDIESAGREFKGCIMETAKALCGIIQCQTGVRGTKWWNENVETVVRQKKGA